MERGIVRDGLAMARSLLTGQSWMMVRDDRAEMRRMVDRLVAKQSFDIAHADQLNMAQYVERVDGVFKVLDTHNALWLLYKRLWETMEPGTRKVLLGRDWRLLKRYEGRLVRTFDAVIAVSEADTEALLEAAGQPREVTVIPIAIDTNDVKLVKQVAEPNHILHIGTMFWPPNIDGVSWFIHEVYPRIREERPDVTFDVVGSRPPADLVALNENGTGINVTGYVEDPTPYLQQAAVFVVPLRAGGGMRVKILNALAQGLPIVSTTLGAEGIAVIPGREILLADKPDDFAAAVLELLEDPALANRLRINGRRLVEDAYDYRRACRPLSNLYQRATAGAPLGRRSGVGIRSDGRDSNG
jgi:glycosyltransferase involved in cell wall biosynthesis